MHLRSFPSSRKQRFLFGTPFLVLSLLAATLVVFLTQHPGVIKRVSVTTSSRLTIHISGNQLVNEQGQPIRLIGINRIADSFCVKPLPNTATVFGPTDAASVAAMASWHINAVRLTMNEDCWLGINGVHPAYSGVNYRNAIVNFVNLLHSYGMYAIIDLHWNAPGTNLSAAQQVMSDADHAPAYWQSIASTFKNDPATIFELYNEPFIQTTNAKTSNPWACWRDGCTITTFVPCEDCAPIPLQWRSAGEQSLINAIRSTGVTNPIIVSGLSDANDLSQLFAYLPSDPQHQLIASFHTYKGEACDTENCWSTVIAPIAQRMPIITTEFGEQDCRTSFVTSFMTWADSHNISYLPWLWAPWECDAYGLIADWNGTPSTYGRAFYNHFHAITLTP